MRSFFRKYGKVLFSLVFILVAAVAALATWLFYYGALPPWRSHVVTSEYQNGSQRIVVLTPDSYDPKKKYRVLYALPTARGMDWGILPVFWSSNIANRYDLIVVTMSFENVPWYGDHPTDPKIRQESYLRDFVVPYIEKHYSTLGTKEGRLLIGFSKSGWGDVSLILRNPDVFGYAASWDAPFLVNHFAWGDQPVFATLDHFAKYRPDLLAPQRKGPFQEATRLVIGGKHYFGPGGLGHGRDHTAEMHALLEANGIRHVYLPDLPANHTWNSVWLEPTVKALVDLANSGGAPTGSH